MRHVDERELLLDLLREAGPEAVTLDELEVVGVSDPASALLALEEAGHSVQRVVDNRATCVRLVPFDGVPVVRAAPVPPAPSAPSRRDTRPLVVAALAFLLVLLLSRR